MSSYNSKVQRKDTRQPRGNRSGCSCCKILFVVLLLAGTGVGLGLYFGLISVEDLMSFRDRLRDTFDDILATDPFAGSSGTSSDPNDVSEVKWRTNGSNGLKLEVVNALDDRWTPFFDQAVIDWDNGDPDALTLTTSRVSPDPSCSPINGKMKVCNDDYGATGWRGINYLVYIGKEIQNSVAEMNEYYLDSQSSTSERTYTMCHEIGHGFGLLHTDENFLNSPKGDCMDYSNNLKPNLLPGLINYQRLANMYGMVSGSGTTGRRNLRKSNTKCTGSLCDKGEIETVVVPEKIMHTFQDKKRSLFFKKSNMQSPQIEMEDGGKATTGYDDNVPSNIHERRRSQMKDDGWTMLHQHEWGEVHRVSLGDGYYGLARILLAAERP